MMKNIISGLLSSICFILLIDGCGHISPETTLSNGIIEIRLSVNSVGVPYIKNVIASENMSVCFSDASEGTFLQKRLESHFTGRPERIRAVSGWVTSGDSMFIKAEASVKAGSTTFTMHVELMKDEGIFRVYNSVKAGETTKICEFPVLSASLNVPDSTKKLHWWTALKFTSQQEEISSDTHVSLFSRIHSSDSYGQVTGNVPYWTLSSRNSFTAFGLAWCGGWRANLNGRDENLDTDVYLPEEETQLSLEAGESISGPELTIFCSGSPDPIFARKSWTEARHSMAAERYPRPEIGYPFIYNHWYAVEFDLSEQFVSDQVKHFNDFGFDVFMIDAGWYKGVGSWTPDPLKFPGDDYFKALKIIQKGGAMAGLWSAPHLISDKGPLPAYIDKPGRHNPFMHALVIDYNALDFSKFLKLHLDTLTNQLGAGWWKFDQEFFSERPPSGKMKSVKAFQKGFADARIAYPELIFEACMGGGKMINEFTDAISQIHWIRDGERTGYIHAVENIYEALGAIEFMEPQKSQRWTNRINETEMKSPELLKFYCRSCMAGSWGISADLNKISPEQRTIILSEVKNYRMLNEIKKSNLVEFAYPGEYTSLVPVVFYDDSLKKAGILFYRLFPKDKKISMKIKTRLNQELTYIIYDADNKSEKIVKGSSFELELKPGQMSALYFINEKLQ